MADEKRKKEKGKALLGRKQLGGYNNWISHAKGGWQ